MQEITYERSLPARNQLRLVAGVSALAIGMGLHPVRGAATMLGLSKATVVVRSGTLPPAEQTAARVLVEEVRTRTGLNWKISTVWPSRGAVIAISSGSGATGWPRTLPRRSGPDLPELRPEGFRLTTDGGGSQPGVVWIHGADSGGALFGVGQLLRSLHWARRFASIPAGLDIATAPAQPIRGHQIGYRAAANSYDGWDDRQYEQYIRELALFGANSIENIPFQDERKSPLMPLPRDVMNLRLIQKYLGPYTSGFISYSDGVHDDVNKTIWSRLGWQPEADPREILLEYTRCFFGSAVAESAADGILALERNWEGPLAANGGVDATLALWQQLESQTPQQACNRNTLERSARGP